jgi:hypothetical protein
MVVEGAAGSARGDRGEDGGVGEIRGTRRGPQMRRPPSAAHPPGASASASPADESRLTVGLVQVYKWAQIYLTDENEMESAEPNAAQPPGLRLRLRPSPSPSPTPRSEAALLPLPLRAREDKRDTATS